MPVIILIASCAVIVCSATTYMLGQNAAGRRYQYTVAQLRVQARRARIERDEACALVRQYQRATDHQLTVVK